MPNLPYSSSAWSTHHEIGIRRIEYPIPQDLTAFLVVRTYQGPVAGYSPMALDTADTEFTSAYFVEQGPLENVDGGQVRYTRTFATVPATRTEYEAYAYRYPGFDVLGDARDPFTSTVAAEVEHTFTRTSSPGAISLPSPFVYDGNYLTDSTNPSYDDYDALTDLTIDVSLSRWRGNIWEKVVRTIPKL